MRRRTLLQIGFGSAAVLAVAGGGLALLRPGLQAGHLTPPGREVFLAIARAVLDGVLPTEPDATANALVGHMDRMDATIASLPGATRSELSQLLALLASSAGRMTLAGLISPWDTADVAAVQASLQAMRRSSLALRQQAYHALRDLTNAAYFADPSAWPAIGYPGPKAI